MICFHSREVSIDVIEDSGVWYVLLWSPILKRVWSSIRDEAVSDVELTRILTEKVKSTIIILHTNRENVEHVGDCELLYKGRELSNLGAV